MEEPGLTRGGVGFEQEARALRRMACSTAASAGGSPARRTTLHAGWGGTAKSSKPGAPSGSARWLREGAVEGLTVGGRGWRWGKGGVGLGGLVALEYGPVGLVALSTGSGGRVECREGHSAPSQWSRTPCAVEAQVAQRCRTVFTVPFLRVTSWLPFSLQVPVLNLMQ
jgi:hypothetical protein